MRRRDTYVLAPEPTKAEASEGQLIDWLSTVRQAPGYLGATVQRTRGRELPEGTLLLSLEFESSESFANFMAATKEVGSPISLDDRSAGEVADQRHSLTDGSGSSALIFDRGGRCYARLFHAHCDAIYEHRATGATSSDGSRP